MHAIILPKIALPKMKKFRLRKGSIPIGLARAVGYRLRTRGRSQLTHPPFMAPLAKLVEYSMKYVDNLPTRPKRQKR